MSGPLGFGRSREIARAREDEVVGSDFVECNATDECFDMPYFPNCIDDLRDPTGAIIWYVRSFARCRSF
jgi:hypothetical protein